MSEEFYGADGQVMAVIRSKEETEGFPKEISFTIKRGGGRKSHFTEQEIGFIRTEALKGTEYKKIANDMGKKYTTVLNVIRSLGLPLRKVGKIILSEAQEKSLMNDCLGLQMDYYAIAAKHKMSIASVKRLVRLWKLPGHYNHEHPARKRIYYLIKKWYGMDELSTLQIAGKLRRMGFLYHNDEFVRDVLIRLHIKRRKNTAPKNILYQYYRYKHLNQRAGWTGKKIVKYLKQNYSIRTMGEMRKETGLSQNAIARRVKLLGLTLARIKTERREIYERIAYEYVNNPEITLKELAKKYRIGANTASYNMRRMNVTVTRRKIGGIKKEIIISNPKEKKISGNIRFQKIVRGLNKKTSGRKEIILKNIDKPIGSGELYEKIKSHYNNYKMFQRDIKGFSKEGLIKTKLFKRQMGGYVTLISKSKK